MSDTPDTSPRAVLTAAHQQAAQACGDLALILTTGRGLTPSRVVAAAAAFEFSAAALRALLDRQGK